MVVYIYFNNYTPTKRHDNVLRTYIDGGMYCVDTEKAAHKYPLINIQEVIEYAK